MRILTFLRWLSSFRSSLLAGKTRRFRQNVVSAECEMRHPLYATQTRTLTAIAGLHAAADRSRKIRQN